MLNSEQIKLNHESDDFLAYAEIRESISRYLIDIISSCKATIEYYERKHGDEINIDDWDEYDALSESHEILKKDAAKNILENLYRLFE